MHLPEFTFPRKLIFQNLHLPEFTFRQNCISPKTYFLAFTLDRIYLWPKLNYPENLFSRNYTHQPGILLLIEFILRKYMIMNDYDCSVSKIIKLRLTRTTKKAKEGILSRL